MTSKITEENVTSPPSNIGSSKIYRPTKRLNRHHKATNHASNLMHRANISREFAEGSRITNRKGDSLTPFVEVRNPPGPFHPRRYSRSN